MASAIAGFTPTQTATTSTSSALNGMTSGDFLNLMIQQLQQQDPLNPTDSNQLLTQMSQISTLQSNTQMQTSLQGLTLQQSIGAGGNLIGKTINGIDPNGNQLQGVVTGVTVANQQVSLSLDSGSSLPLANVTQISNTGAAALSSLASSAPQLQQLLSSLSGTNGSTNTSTAVSQLQQLLGALGGTTSAATNAASTTPLQQLINSLGGTTPAASLPAPTGVIAPLAGT